MADDQKKLQELSDDYNKIQEDIQSIVSARQKLESQEQENKSVQKEFSLLPQDANIYKQLGPVLLKQDKAEADMAVAGRLAFIEKEIKRVEEQITDLQGKSEGKRAEVMRLQGEMQARAQGSQAG